MTARDVLELQKYVGRKGKYRQNGWAFDVEVVSARSGSGGQVDLLVTPMAGEGQVWLSAGLVELFDEDEKGEG